MHAARLILALLAWTALTVQPIVARAAGCCCVERPAPGATTSAVAAGGSNCCSSRGAASSGAKSPNASPLGATPSRSEKKSASPSESPKSCCCGDRANRDEPRATQASGGECHNCGSCASQSGSKKSCQVGACCCSKSSSPPAVVRPTALDRSDEKLSLGVSEYRSSVAPKLRADRSHIDWVRSRPLPSGPALLALLCIWLK